MNILEYKRKLLGHHFLKGDGGGGGGGGGANEGNAGEAEARAYVDKQAQADREQAGREAARQAEAAAQAQAQAESQAQAQAAKEQAARDAREAQMAAEQASREQAARDAQAAADKAAQDAAAAEAARQPITESAPEAPAAEAPAPVASEAPAAPPVPEGVPPSFDFDAKPPEVLAKYAKTLKDTPSSATGTRDLDSGLTKAERDLTTAQAFAAQMGPLTRQTMTFTGKNGDKEVSVDVPSRTFMDVFGRAPTYGEAKALGQIGLGNVTGVNPSNLTQMNAPVLDGNGNPIAGLTTNDPGQTADSIVATTDFVNFVGPIAKAAAMFIPGMSLAMTIKDLNEGKTTLGDITSNFALGLLAKHLGINVNVAKAVINGDFGGALASTMIGQLNPALAKELGINPRLASIIGKETGVYGALSKAFDNTFSGFDQSSWGSNTKDFANAINSGFQNIGITTGTGGENGATGRALNLGFGAEDAMGNYLGTNNGGPTLGTPTPPSTTPSITAPTKPVTKPTTPITPTTPSTIAPGVSTTGTGASTINTQGNLFNPMGLTASQTQQMTNAFPQLANVFYYGKDLGSKKQKLDENNQLVFDEPDQGLASGGRIADNKDDAIDAYIRHIVEQSGGPVSQRELLAIVKGI